MVHTDRSRVNVCRGDSPKFPPQQSPSSNIRSLTDHSRRHILQRCANTRASRRPLSERTDAIAYRQRSLTSARYLYGVELSTAKERHLWLCVDCRVFERREAI